VNKVCCSGGEYQRLQLGWLDAPVNEMSHPTIAEQPIRRCHLLGDSEHSRIGRRLAFTTAYAPNDLKGAASEIGFAFTEEVRVRNEDRGWLSVVKGGVQPSSQRCS
jgi:hypothetical protein